MTQTGYKRGRTSRLLLVWLQDSIIEDIDVEDIAMFCFKVALNPHPHISLNFEKVESVHVDYNSIIKSGCYRTCF